jgi:predicted Fe-Mo cluster-binding NifX family protein
MPPGHRGASPKSRCLVAFTGYPNSQASGPTFDPGENVRPKRPPVKVRGWPYPWDWRSATVAVASPLRDATGRKRPVAHASHGERVSRAFGEFPAWPRFWQASCVATIMVIAIPNCQGRVSPVFDTAARLLVVRRRQGRVVDRKEIQLGPMPGDALARSLTELQIDVLLCAAISESLRRVLRGRGIRVLPHLCGEVEAIMQAFCGGQLRRSEFRMPGCWGHHSDGACCRIRHRHRSDARAGRLEPSRASAHEG